MERKIGEIFEFGGEWYQCVESDSCGECSLFTTECGSGTKKDLADQISKQRGRVSRADNNHSIFKKLEKVGEPYIIGNKLIQRYKMYPTTYHINVYGWYYHNLDVKSWTIDIEIKQNKEDMEENKLNLKPFDIQKAREGKPVCTRGGRKARIICFDRVGDFPIVALTDDREYKEEGVNLYDINGKGSNECFDLMMLPEKKEGWVNIYRSQIYDTLERAKEAYKRTCNDDNYLQTIKIEWEE